MNPLKLTFTANEQALTKTDNFTDFASNTVSYVEATFTLGENWSGYDSVRAVWKTDYYTISTVLDANFTCVVPTEVLRYKAKVFVNLVGSIVENDTLTDRLTTFPVLALTVKANAAVNGSETAPVTPSQFEQFVDTVRDAAGSISDYSYDSEAWAVGTRGGVDVPSTDETYHNNSKYWAEQNAGLSDEVADLKSEISEKVAITGEHQVTPQNLEGMQFTKTTGEVEGENIFTSDMLFAEGKYVIVASDDTVGIGSNASFNAYCIPVEQNTKYKFTTSRFVALANGNTFGSPAIGTTMSNLSEVETGEATHLFLSINVDSISNIQVKPVTVDVVYSDFILPDWLVNNLPIPTVVEKPKFATVTGDIVSGGNLQLTAPRNNLRKGERIVFEGNVTSFSSIKIGLSFSTAVGTEANQMNTFLIDGTNISYYARSDSTPVTVAHGLTIANNIQIIWEMTATASVKFTLISNGNLFEHEFTNFARKTIGKPFVLSIGTALTDCKLTWTCTDIDKNIWMFGDSYFAYSNVRWTYYLHQYGYDQNCLLDGFPGEGGLNGRVAFNNLSQYGTPKFAVWCLGMNDGGDSASAPSSDWVRERDYFLQICENNDVTPIFGTIPTVPSINHEQKNAWIRSSGYRYIDFAKAVGANSSGVWYSGMLSGDAVHPTEQGAKALFARVLLDLPEIMVDGTN